MIQLGVVRLANAWHEATRRTHEKGEYELWGVSIEAVPTDIFDHLDALLSLPGLTAWDRLPWTVTRSLLPGSQSVSAGHDLFPNLSHGTAAIRAWCLELFWLAPELERMYDDETLKTIRENLLANVADKILHVDLSLACLQRVSEDENAFWAACDSFTPEKEWEEQYKRRIEDARQRRYNEILGVGVALDNMVLQVMVDALGRNL